MKRVPIRWRLTFAFTLAMGVVLTATGVFLHARLATELDNVANATLRDRATDVAALVQTGTPRLSDGARLRGEFSFAQLVDAAGAVHDATPGLGDRVRLPARALAPAAARVVVLPQVTVAGYEEALRVRAMPLDVRGERRIMVVGISLEPREDALELLQTQLLIGFPVALLLSSLIGYAVSAAALRPVEAMRAEALAASTVEPGRRLPLPAARDEIRSLGTTLNEMLGRLEAGLVRERRFVAEAGHELRTPLALLRTELELALRRPRSPSELTAALQSAAEETERLCQLAEDLLVLAQSDDGGLPLHRTEVSTKDLMSAVADRFAARARATDRPVFVADGPSLDLRADQIRLEQALTNLVDNGFRHGTGPVRLSAVATPGGTVELHVRDAGRGVPRDLVERAFEPFSRAAESRSARLGAGLGLAIVAAIARAHGGTVGTASTDDGADVWLSLPRS